MYNVDILGSHGLYLRFERMASLLYRENCKQNTRELLLNTALSNSMTSLLVTTNPVQPYAASIFYAVSPMFFAVGRDKNGPKRKNSIKI